MSISFLHLVKNIGVISFLEGHDRRALEPVENIFAERLLQRVRHIAPEVVVEIDSAFIAVGKAIKISGLLGGKGCLCISDCIEQLLLNIVKRLLLIKTGR